MSRLPVLARTSGNQTKNPESRPTHPRHYLPTSGFRAKLPEYGRPIPHVLFRLPVFARSFRKTTGGIITFCLDLRFSRKLPEARQRTPDPARAPSVLLAGFRISREGKGTKNKGIATSKEGSFVAAPNLNACQRPARANFRCSRKPRGTRPAD